MGLLIGLTGKAHSGKDEAAKYLVEKHGMVRMAFADKLKEAAEIVFGVSKDGDKESPLTYWGISRRQMWQGMGEALDIAFPDVWIDRFHLIYQMMSQNDVVVTDVRKDKEADYIRNMGGKIVEISRKEAGLAGQTGEHVTERGISSRPDFLLRNEGTLKDLYHSVESIYQEVKSAHE